MIRTNVLFSDPDTLELNLVFELASLTINQKLHLKMQWIIPSRVNVNDSPIDIKHTGNSMSMMILFMY